MIIFLCAAVVLMFIFYVPQIARGNDVIIKDYISKEAVLPIKGFFVLLVFMSHFIGYASLNPGILDSLFVKLIGLIGQLMVVMFLFYSGFGIYESYKQKGQPYVQKFMSHRLLPTWISFAICLFVYLLASIFFKSNYSLDTVILSFTGWTAIGNSNWFMFDTFVLYLIFLLVFSLVKQEHLRLPVFIGMTCALIGILFYLKESWWWNTLLCFPAGMIFSRYKDKIDTYIEKSNKRWWIAFVFSLISFVAFYILGVTVSGAFYLIAATIFAAVVVVFSMKVKFRSVPFSFLGKHVFSIYILQRLIFTILSSCFQNPYLLFVSALTITLTVAYIYDKVFDICRVILSSFFHRKEVANE